jgi:uncharacterized repeat protein (TIGR03803 family)
MSFVSASINDFRTGRRSNRTPVAMALALCLSLTAFSLGQDTILHNFTGSTTDGSLPANATLTLSGATFYGVTLSGGSGEEGTVFSVAPDGSNFTLLHSFSINFNDGESPIGAPVVSGSEIYGLTSGGGGTGGGAVYSMNLNGSGFSLLHGFTGGSDGDFPYGSLSLSGSQLYGMTSESGGGLGTIFTINTNGTGYSILHSFTNANTDGASPMYGALTISGSTVYGMTEAGGNSNDGTVFSMNTDGADFTLLHNFTGAKTDGGFPQGVVDAHWFQALWHHPARRQPPCGRHFQHEPGWLGFYPPP